MLRNWVNFGLLSSFLTLAVSGLLAVWPEATNGSMIETLYLDEELAYGEGVTRKGVDPKGEIVAYTVATPECAFALDQHLNSGKEGRFIISVEVNALGDADETYENELPGQPSLLYTAHIDASEGAKYQLLELTAHGGEAIESGALNYDFAGIDNARQLIDLLLVRSEKMKS